MVFFQLELDFLEASQQVLNLGRLKSWRDAIGYGRKKAPAMRGSWMGEDGLTVGDRRTVFGTYRGRLDVREGSAALDACHPADVIVPAASAGDESQEQDQGENLFHVVTSLSCGTFNLARATRGHIDGA